MEGWAQLLLAPDRPVQDALKVLNDHPAKIVLVADAGRRLLGTITDGDVRRHLVRGGALADPCRAAMSATPTKGPAGLTREDAVALMRAREIQHLPVVDGGDGLVGLHLLKEIEAPTTLDNWVVLMAGGEGRRLRPMTDDTPKPMLRVGGRPILETILRAFAAEGFRRFFLSVNYKAELIRAHFGDGRAWGVTIAYLEETAQLGTAGCLGLLPAPPTAPVVVMNGDLLTRVNFRALLDYHHSHGAEATMCVREYAHEVPFGVVEMEGERLTAVAEKPVTRYFVNAGIYVLEPAAVARLPPGLRYDMPTLFRDLIAAGRRCCSFPVHEYWIDIGRMSDLERAHREFERHFALYESMIDQDDQGARP